MGRPPNTINRFHELYEPVPECGCWVWLGSVSSRGYGKITIDGTVYQAHRLSYATHSGPVGDMCVLHRCDMPLCVNPDHLFLGTNADNVADMDSKGRRVTVRGEGNGQAKLTEQDVRDIRASTSGHSVLGRKYGVNRSNIIAIRQRRSWKHVDS